jgi:hypothetical protein
MKTVFELDHGLHERATIQIIGKEHDNKPYVAINGKVGVPAGLKDFSFFIKDKDLERFAVNILKAIKSKKLR